MEKFPVLFLSHGSPMMALEESPARRFLQDLGRRLPRPKAILVISAHWETAEAPLASFAAQPETIHDFGNFSPALFALRYPAPGAPEAAGRATRLLRAAGIRTGESPDRGLDHGAWIPLSLIYPEADLPVFQISLVHGEDPAYHYRLGAALAPLREEGVLIIGSGSITHNLREIFRLPPEAPEAAWSRSFRDWVADRLAAADTGALLAYRTQAPAAVQNHPTEEHLLPLHVALGAAGGATRATRLHDSFQLGALGMDAYIFSG